MLKKYGLSFTISAAILSASMPAQASRFWGQMEQKDFPTVTRTSQDGVQFEAPDLNFTEFYSGFGVEYFDWIEEVDRLDRTFVSEYGPKLVYNEGRTGKFTTDSGFYDGYDFKFKLGYVSYHGGARFEEESIDDVDGKTFYGDVEYFYNLNQRYILNNEMAFDLKASLGGKHWSRIIMGDDVTLSNGDKEDVGAYEAYFGLYAKAGLGLNIHDKVYLEAGVQAPLFVVEYSNSENNDDFLYPKTELGYYAEAEYRFDNHYFAKAYISEFNYAKSSVNDSGFYQPESDSTAYGLIIGAYIR